MNALANLSADVLRAYRKHRAAGLPAKVALEWARSMNAAPKYDFLAEFGEYGIDRVTGTVGPYTVTAEIMLDEDWRLGDDDVSGTFTDDYDDTCVKNITDGINGSGLRWYKPSAYTLDHAMADYRRAGMSKGVAAQAVRMRVRDEMRQDAERLYSGVTVMVEIDGTELGNASVWGIDTIPSLDPGPYFRETADGLIGEAIDDAKVNLPARLRRVLSRAQSFAAALDS